MTSDSPAKLLGCSSTPFLRKKGNDTSDWSILWRNFSSLIYDRCKLVLSNVITGANIGPECFESYFGINFRCKHCKVNKRSKETKKRPSKLKLDGCDTPQPNRDEEADKKGGARYYGKRKSRKKGSEKGNHFKIVNTVKSRIWAPRIKPP